MISDRATYFVGDASPDELLVLRDSANVTFVHSLVDVPQLDNLRIFLSSSHPHVVDRLVRFASCHSLTIGTIGNVRAKIRFLRSGGISTIDVVELLIYNLIFLGNGRKSEFRDGLSIAFASVKSAYTFLLNLTVTRFPEFGIKITTLLSGAETRNVFVLNCETSWCGMGGLVITSNELLRRSQSKLHYIKDAYSEKAKFAHTNLWIDNHVAIGNSGVIGHYSHSGSGIILEDCSHGFVTNSLAAHNGRHCDSVIGGACGIWAANSFDVAFVRCISIFNRTAGYLDGGGFDLDGGVSFGRVQRCFSGWNSGSGIMTYSYPGEAYEFKNNSIVGNAIIQVINENGYGAIHVGGRSSYVHVGDNLVYLNSAEGIGLCVTDTARLVSFEHNTVSMVDKATLFEISDEVGLLFALVDNWNTVDKARVRFSGLDYDQSDWHLVFHT